MAQISDSDFDLSLTIGGDAGQGIQSSGSALSLAFARAGLHVFGTVDYRSRIRGGHNFYQLRASTRPVFSHADPVSIVIAMTEDTTRVHLDNLADGGVVLYDDAMKDVNPDEITRAGGTPFAAPLSRLAEKHGSRVMMNTAALGAAAALIGFPVRYLEDVLRDSFSAKGDRVVEANLQVVREAHDFARRSGPVLGATVPQGTAGRQMVIHGNHALALGAVAGGCRFISAYPMTPATSIFEWLTKYAEEIGVVTKHAEDELAAICMAIGAGAAGARAMTCTSGGGFSLMTEALGMAGMLEIPVVLAVIQRGGPSTGLPTRTEQGDLLFVWHASQGEFPRIIMAPGDVEQAYDCSWRAFNLAEKYQCPVIIISDQFLGSSVRSVKPNRLSLSRVKIDRGKTLTVSDLDHVSEPYLRFRVTEDGISPRALPGHPAAVYSVSTDEHSEDGHINESIESRIRQFDKRMRKLETAEAEMRTPTWYGPAGADLTLVCWGSTYGPARECVDLLSDRGQSVNMLHFVDIWPMPASRVAQELSRAKTTVAVEQNYESQLARLLRMVTGHVVDRSIKKYDGRPFTPQDIAVALESEVVAGVR